MNPAVISRTAKQRFLLQLSEDAFRDLAVRPLFLLKGFKDGRDLCGPTEQGKDALFYDYDRLGKLELTAIQTKAGSINLAAKASQNIVDLVAQLRTAASTAYPLLMPVKAKTRASKTILVASGRINDSARRHLVDEVNDNGLQFLDADDLIPWIDEVMPHFWLDIDANVSAYYVALEKQILGSDGPFAKQFAVTSNAPPESCFGNDAIAVHVRRSRQSLSKGKKKGAKSEASTFPLHALPTKPYRRVLLVGDGGAGKTTGLLQIVYRAARSGIEQESQSLIPVLVTASDVCASTSDDLCSYLVDVTSKLAATKKPVFGMTDLNAGHVHVFVDGLDELADADKRALVVERANSFLERFPQCQVIISSRPYEFLAELSGLADYERFDVVPIDWADAERILDNAKLGKAVSNQTLKASLQHLSQIQGFTLNPLMISVYAVTSSFEAKDVPPNVTELFKRYTEQMLGRWDEQKGLDQLHRPLLKDFVLTSLAFFMHESNITRISKAKAISLVKEKLTDTGYNEDANSIISEIIARSSLLRDYGDELGFRHHMFQEFFAGRAIPSESFIIAKCSNAWWRRAIVFYFGDRPRDASQLTPAVKEISTAQVKEKYSALCTIGLALQACYLSNVTDKISIWKEVVSGLSVCFADFAEVNDPNNEAPILTKVAHRIQARDSVSLSNIADHEPSIRKWIEEAPSHKEDLHEFFILALMRIGRFDLVSKAEITASIGDLARKLVFLVETSEAAKVRPIALEQKKIATSLNNIASEDSDNLFHSVIREFEGQLRKLSNAHRQLTEATTPVAAK